MPANPGFDCSTQAACDSAELDAWLVKAGLRRTRATLAVLHLFVSDASWSATHAEVALALEQHQGLMLNRVTLYRLLDRLAACGLLTRQSDDVARTWRYRLADAALLSAVEGGASGVQAAAGEAVQAQGAGVVPRFECDACHRQFRLTEASSPTQAVAQQLLQALATMGHHGQRVDLSIHGTCAVCVEPEDKAAA